MDSLIVSLMHNHWIQMVGVGAISGILAWFIRENRNLQMLFETIAIAIFSALFISPLAISLLESFGSITLDESAKLSVTSIISISSYGLVKQLVDQGLVGFITSMKSSLKSSTPKSKPKTDETPKMEDKSGDERAIERIAEERKKELLRMARDIKNGE